MEFERPVLEGGGGGEQGLVGGRLAAEWIATVRVRGQEGLLVFFSFSFVHTILNFQTFHSLLPFSNLCFILTLPLSLMCFHGHLGSSSSVTATTA